MDFDVETKIHETWWHAWKWIFLKEKRKIEYIIYRKYPGEQTLLLTRIIKFPSSKNSKEKLLIKLGTILLYKLNCS